MPFRRPVRAWYRGEAMW